MTNELLWQPSRTRVHDSQMDHFRRHVNKTFNVDFRDYQELYDWSVSDIPAFWETIWSYMDIINSQSYSDVLVDGHKMPGASWFPGAKMNFAENLLRHRDNRPAIIAWTEEGPPKQLSYADLYDKVARLAQAMRKYGVQKGDRVGAFMPNITETIIAMLAATSIGAIWSSTSPDFGISGVVDRFKQIQPKWLFSASGYVYKGKWIDINKKLVEIVKDLPSLERVIQIMDERSTPLDLDIVCDWDETISEPAKELTFEQLPFDHPIYIMFSSGTTGLPKSIVHSAGGTLLQHLKELRLHSDLNRDDRIFYFTTCGWMMWNWLVTSLATGAAVVLFDGNPFYPEPSRLLDMIDESEISIFGTSARYIAALEEAGVIPKDYSKFPSLKAILSTGSPLAADSFDYVYTQWKSDVQLSSIAGGTDIISCFNLGNPVLPVYRDEIQCRGLGMKVSSYNSAGHQVIDQKGELVCTAPFPSMPIYFWNDEDGQKYFNAYFSTYPNIWHHGDFVILSNHGGVTMCGRSDATLNPSGVRMGTAEFYTALSKLTEIQDSVVVGKKYQDDERIVLFVKLNEEMVLDQDMIKKISTTLRIECSPRHIPWRIIQVDDIPYTINGKKVEIAVKKAIHNEEITNLDALANPDVLNQYVDHPELK